MSTPTSPKILIAGGGIGGLFMGVLLEKAGLDYQIYESSTEFLPLGAACGLSYNIMAAVDQLGMLEDLNKISTTVEINTIFKQDMEVIREIRLRENKLGTGYDTLVTSRPEFHALLLSHIPKEKIHMGKKIVSLEQDLESVTITCEDQSTYTGDLLIGADGAYSDVRKAMYKDMEKDGVTPQIKVDDPKIHIMSYLGVAENLNPANYEGLGEEESHSDTIIGEGRGETWRYFTATDNRVCWRFDYQSNSMSPEEIDAWKNSNYLAFPKESINPEFRKYELAIMGNLGQMFDATPKERLSKVVLEENVPQSWYHKRTVLIGDAAHRVLPNFGALNAILDTIILSNALYEMPNANHKNVTRAFEEFYAERFPNDERDLSPRQQQATILAGKTWLDTAGRFLLMKMVPKYFKERSLEYICQYRPQVTFLPRIESKGSVQSTPQRPSKKYAALAKLQGSSPVAATAV